MKFHFDAPSAEYRKEWIVSRIVPGDSANLAKRAKLRKHHIFSLMRLKSIILACLTALSAECGAQTVEQYCELTVSLRLSARKVDVRINFGNDRNPKPWLAKDSLGNVKEFTNAMDALNYMGTRGWKLVNAYPVAGSETGGFTESHYIFRKEVAASELRAPKAGE